MASFLEKISQIHARVSRSVDDQKRTFYLPKALVDVFNPMIIYVCICSQVSDELSPEWRLLQRRARKILQSLQIAEYQLISMIHAGDFSEAKVFRRVNAQDIVTMVTERLVQIPNENPTEKSSSDGFNLLQIYRQYILGLVRITDLHATHSLRQLTSNRNYKLGHLQTLKSLTKYNDSEKSRILFTPYWTSS